MSKHLPIGILQHYFTNYDPATSKCLRDTSLHFHMRELEATDYRSAYHQFSDWLYGWSVSDGADANFDKLNLRNPREINMEMDREKQEAQRLMKTFETLTSRSLRHLKVCYNDIEAEMPRLGQGLDTFTNNHPKETSSTGDLTAATANTIEKVWGDKVMEEDPEHNLHEVPIIK